MNVETALKYSRRMLSFSGSAMLSAGLIEWSRDIGPISYVLMVWGLTCVVFNEVISHKVKKG